MQRQTGVNLLKGLKKVVNLYRARNFNIRTLYMDGEFEKVRNLMKDDGDLKSSLLNTTSAGEHVPDIERRIRVIKECVRAEKCSLPYSHYPIIMVTDMINWIVTWLNVFPMSGGIQGVSPRALIVGTALNYQQHCRCPFGA